MQLKGTFQITNWRETVIHSFDSGAKLSKALVSQSYSGDINGSSEVHYQLNYESSGEASFNGFEFFSGNFGETACQLTLKHDGTFEQGVAKSQFVIISSSTHAKLLGLKGVFSSGEAGQASYMIG
ncbi:hypothetical protein WH43_01720 [Rheinheimera sp. KL1]|uniref:DUF3224 domain-containing protein n=1 Tax=Rheinheimera sp. KL1 TaxID=1635005 RepID=UPI0006A9F421|nr:DUF3224 domain-containing protein [Rheinheimera sp. KL1]KOO59722.1 hypothetical protein WH43_01720 [Rheinheimera sp. KL1]